MRISFLLVMVLLFLITGLCFGQETSKAQAELDALREAVGEDRSSLDALILYPEEIRSAILEACLYPEALVKISGIQARSMNSFREFLAPFSREQQEIFYETVRYQGLVDLALDHSGSQQGIVQALQKYPKEVGRKVLLALANPQTKETLVNIYHLDKAADDVLDGFLGTYPEKAREAFRLLIQQPAVLSILQENMTVTVLIGALYRKDPGFAIQRAAKRNEEATKEFAVAVEDWKKELQDSPISFQQLRSAVWEYAEEMKMDPETALKFSAADESQVAAGPYPYWFGYPYWLNHPTWVTFPGFYDWGFYESEDGKVVVVGLPSHGFVDWVLRSPDRLQRFPNLANTFLAYYERHPNVADAFTQGVGVWIEDQRTLIPAEWLKPDEARSARLKEYGRLQQEMEDAELSRASTKEYVEVRADLYPGLNFKQTAPEALLMPDPANLSTDLQTPGDLLQEYHALNYHNSSSARPYKSGQMFQIPVVKK